jgi:hypothetical protein
MEFFSERKALPPLDEAALHESLLLASRIFDHT